uniref:Type IV secretion system protein VirB3 n=1 Tax=Schistosoma mansoni TaxID=6183 RepID=A0A5K4F962_SCHMA
MKERLSLTDRPAQIDYFKGFGQHTIFIVCVAVAFKMSVLFYFGLISYIYLSTFVDLLVPRNLTFKHVQAAAKNL